jgi:AcrR family transcriptional regulator/DNA-binding transcriptional ArsR family regulator
VLPCVVAATTVDQRGNHRASALVRRIARLEPEPGRLDAVALGLVDAVLEADAETLGAALDALRDARARAGEREQLLGWLDAAIAFAHWGLERVPSPSGVARGTKAHDFLTVLDGSPPLGSAELRRLLETDETQVSRTGRRLLDSGLVTRRKVGRQVFWQLSPRGRRALEQVPEPTPADRADSASFWLEAIRRGFEGAAGDEPGQARRDVDPTRERIVERALELHGSRGIQATTWEEIAASAGVPVGTVKAIFPNQDDLVRACAQHFLESLRMPPPERARDIFADASSEQERIRRLVEASFGVYERGADGIAVGRRERAEVPAVGESMDQLETSLDALVTEALRPRRPDSSSVASVRALTDFEVWRALRDQGATTEAAVEQASAAVGRWLEGHSAR